MNLLDFPLRELPGPTPHYLIAAVDATTILVDFDGDKSVHQMGNGRYRMTPVISVVSVQ